ncbi:MAG: histidine phosphatase family protein [Anaerolineaceae bacterium]
MTELWLVRHGQTDWNLEGRFQGQSDVALNTEGILQAENLADKLMKAITFDAIFSSDLQRASRTAEIIANNSDLAVQIDHRLREVCQGEWEGMLFQDVVNTYQHIWEDRRSNPEAAHPPGGESLAEVTARLIEAADDISRQFPGGRVLVISHGLALATLVCTARKIPLSQVYSHILNNAEPEIVDWPETGFSEDKDKPG